MADSDKDILITPNTGVASTHPKITFTGKDNSPVDLKILDDNTLSFEGAQGQVFSISPTMNSGDIFSVNDISGIQSIAVNADGTITMNAQTQETTIKSSVSNAASLVIENDNNDGNAGPILDLFRNPQDHTVASGDLIGKIAFKGLFYDGSDYDQIKEWASITAEIEHYQGDGSVSFNVLQNGSSTQYLKVDGNAQDIVFNEGSSNDFDVRIESDNDANNFFSDGSAGRIGIGTNAPAAKLHVDAGATVAPSLTFGATAGQILQNENSELAIGLDNDSPYSLWLQARTSGNAARNIVLQPLGGSLGIGTEDPDEIFHVKVASSDSGAIAKFERTSNASVFIGGSNAWGNIWTDDAVLTFGVSSDYGADAQMRLYVNDDTAADAYSILELKGNGDNYINAGISLLALDDDASYRGLGVFMHDAQSDHEWYMGTPYSLSDSWMVGRKATSSHTQSTSDDTNALLIVRNDGKVGIGTTSPAKTLDVAGDIGLTGDIYVAENKKIYFDSTDSYIYADTDSSEDLHIGSDGHIELEPDNDLVVKTGSTEYVRFDGSEQSVGIGTSSPTAKLEIRAASTFNTVNGHIMLSGDSATDGQGPQIVFSESGSSSSYAGAYVGHVRTGSNSTGDLVFGTRATGGDATTVPTERMRILSDGKVGIGTDAPDTTLHVEGSVLIDAYEVGAGAGLYFREGHLNTNQPSITVQDHSGANPDGLAISAYDGISFRLDATEKARFDSAGHLLVNATSYSGTSSHAALEISHGTQSNLRVTDSSASASTDFAQSENDTYIVNRKSGGDMKFRINGSVELLTLDGGTQETLISKSGTGGARIFRRKVIDLADNTNLQLVYATHAGAMINCLGTSTVTLPTSATVGDTYELLTSSAAGTYLTVLAGTNIMINGHTNAGGNSEAKIHHTGSSLVVTCIKASSPLTYVVGTLMAVPFADES